MTRDSMLRIMFVASCGLLLGAVPNAAPSPAGAAPEASSDAMARCNALVGRKLASGTVEKVNYIAKGGKLVDQQTGFAAAFNGLTTPVPFCKVRAHLHPTPDSDITVETWLPDAWNGKMLGIGGGGFSGGLATAALTLRAPMSSGYAAVATDVGHPATETGEWAYGHPERLIDYGYRGNHLAALTAKEVIRAFYGKRAERAYFHGCSNGGRDALMEVSRFPTDYDGIIAGAPAMSFTPLLTSFVVNNLAVSRAPGLAAKLSLLNATVLKKCDGLDGVTDGVLDNPRQCAFDPTELQCKAGSGPNCLSADEVSAARTLYRGVRLSNGRQLMPGFAVGGETTGWSDWITAAKSQQNGLGSEAFRWLVHGDPKWDKTRFDVDRDYRLAEQRVGGIIDSDNPDVRAFTRRGGKLIVYHGWNDAAVPPENSLEYYDAVRRRSDPGGRSVRLFMAPGMSHCFGGPGPNSFDMLPDLDRWVEHGTAPERIIATKFDNDFLALLRMPAKVVRTRPLCAWPKTARYNGSGSTDDAANFTCKGPQ
ncbi:tannase/feruloyl esterase family alpha/beta hydrolase [Novosphingobium sp. P6W]|uniref:tannase/feruloyl esterase family alpha/beta hydrolase n=1 Tax=Novosphingobium sp. P6W TaxID=1609758 RepID=UPI0013B37588|nr:tannase/feruloyl esterase family alpha/beta hydrolase [Novosphingobium sp. P6W]